ncbi:ABC transporter ATP-binding protein [Paraoerskovia marina]|uniref:ABC transporter ATP-binding protein n=1 Tax=Paraoerskovia marina TaxID=545619 RepID=UPI000492A0DB|nr:ABC transporter ATP-binding protein [Paraoerskovia marina]
MSTTDTPVEIHDLVKTFGTVRALDGFSMTVRRGEVAGFLGPNGAGKSTTIRVLLGLIKADGGSARLLGGDPWADAVDLHRRLAYVPGDVNLWPNLSGGEAIDLLTRLRGPVDPGRRADLLERFELDPSKKARTYSKGNRQKVALVAALAADTELLILDEPTSGLDPLMESVFTDCVREATDRGASVLLSSHILGEVEKLCDTVTIIRAGKDVQSGTLDDLRHLTRSTYTADVTGDPGDLTAIDAVHDLTVSPVGDGGVVTVSFSADNDRTDEVVAALSGLGLRRLVTAPPSLEEMFLRHYGDDVTGSRTVQG